MNNAKLTDSSQRIRLNNTQDMSSVFVEICERFAPNIIRQVEAGLRPTWERRIAAEEALMMAYGRRNEDSVVEALATALEGLLDVERADKHSSLQQHLELDDPRIEGAWRNAMGMAIAVVDVKRDESLTKENSKVLDALNQVAAALHAAHDEGLEFKLPHKLGRHKPRTLKPPVPKRLPRTMKEGLLAALPADGKPISRAKVVSQMIIGNFASSDKSASRAFKELIESGQITEQGVRGRTTVALRL